MEFVRGVIDRILRENNKTEINKYLGQKIGQLLIIDCFRKNGDTGQLRVIYECPFGKRHETYLYKIINKHTERCKCFKKNKPLFRKRVNIYDRLYNNIYSVYNNNAKRKKIPFHIDKNNIIDIIFNTCFYCGNKPIKEFKHFNESIYYNGIDRKHNNLGYTKDNIVSCCWKCNDLKSDLDYDFFTQKIKTIAEYHK